MCHGSASLACSFGGLRGVRYSLLHTPWPRVSVGRAWVWRALGSASRFLAWRSTPARRHARALSP